MSNESIAIPGLSVKLLETVAKKEWAPIRLLSTPSLEAQLQHLSAATLTVCDEPYWRWFILSDQG